MAEGFSEFEREAMKERAQELRQAAVKKNDRANGLADIFEKIAEMTDDEARIANQLHTLVEKYRSDLLPKAWYGMPAYTNAAGQVVVFFQPAGKFKARYSTIGFQDSAQIDDGDIWPTSFAVPKWTDKVESVLIDLIKQL